MTSLKERSVFFPSQKFDGRNKELTKQHWQGFQDFCNQQKLYIENTDDHRAATINEVQPFFKMTLTDLARAWLERETFTSPADLKEKFLRDFSPYGKTPRQWIAKWAALKFNPDTDNIDEFIAHFEDLASLNNIQDDYKLHAFKIAMPREVELHLSRSSNLQDCYQTAKELLTIVQTTVTNKMSALSLAQSRSPSPQAKARSPSPTTPPPQRFRLRTQAIFQDSHRRLPFRCFNCHKLGHFARNCFIPPRVRFQDEHTSTNQGTDSEGHQTLNGHSSTDMPQNQNPNTYSDPQQDEYSDEEENNFEEYYDEYYDEDETSSEEYYVEDENSFKEG